MELSWEELNSLLVLTAVQRGKMGEDIKCGRIESKEWENNSWQGWAVADAEAESREENVECRSDTGPCSCRHSHFPASGATSQHSFNCSNQSSSGWRKLIKAENL